MKTYEIEARLLQTIVNYLQTKPHIEVDKLIRAIEIACTDPEPEKESADGV